MPYQDPRGKIIYELLQKSGGDPAVSTEAILRYVQDFEASNRKDAMPGNRPNTGWLYDNGPFSLDTEDVISMAVDPRDPLLAWLPTAKTTSRKSQIAHIDWIGPKGFDGSQTYPEYLRSVAEVLPECGYGPSTDWSGFAYSMEGGSFSWKTDVMKPYPDGGIKYSDRSPQMLIRGSGAGQKIENDKDWAVARLLTVASQHYAYVVKHGNASNSAMEWDGLSRILTPGYVQARTFSGNAPLWANPVIVNGLSLTDPGVALGAIRSVVRTIRNRIRLRNWAVNAEDMVVKMPAAMWDIMSEYVAMGALHSYTNRFGFAGVMQYDEFLKQLNQTRTGGIGFGTMNIDNVPIAVLPDVNDGMNTTLTDAEDNEISAVAGDIYVLTRRANGMTLLEQNVVDWSQLDYPTNGLEDDTFTLQGGAVRAGWVTEANKCFYYYIEMAGRLSSYMQPLQGRVNNVVIPAPQDPGIEGGSFTSLDWYAYGGRQGGHGSSIITPV